jgi:pseudouridine-5'-phosphate glycosidase
VHREAQESWDISADLLTLSRTLVAVVCAGVKSILDISATLEYLETLGVPIVGFRTRSFPGFYLTDSGSPLDWAVVDEKEAARLIDALRELVGPEGPALVVANPIPEEEQLNPELHELVLETGQVELRRLGIHGKNVTPFLLDHFLRETQGESLRVNEQIIRNNARLAARISINLAALEAEDTSSGETMA